MTWQQLVPPNLSPTLKQGSETITNWSGWCLLFVQSAFNAGWSGSSAWDAWTSRLTHKHADRNIPAGVYVPIWFDGHDNGQRQGHAAIYKDGKVYSSPYYPAANLVLLNSIEEVERIYRMKYVGWSEDIGGKKVIENQEEDMKADNYIVQALAEAILGRTAANDKNLQNNIGLDVKQVIDTMRTYPEAKERARKANEYDRIKHERDQLESAASQHDTSRSSASLDKSTVIDYITKNLT